MSTILLVDDNEPFRRMLVAALSKQGYNVIEAINGNFALKEIRKKTVDLIIIDIIMPDKEGIETIIDIKKKKPGAKIIAISGGGVQFKAEYNLKVAKAVGAECILKKPFELKILFNAIEKLITTE